MNISPPTRLRVLSRSRVPCLRIIRATANPPRITRSSLGRMSAPITTPKVSERNPPGARTSTFAQPNATRPREIVMIASLLTSAVQKIVDGRKKTR